MKLKKIGIGIFLFFMGSILVSCNRKEMLVDEPIVIPAIFLIDSETGMEEKKQLVERFNEEYKGTYSVQVEWMIGTPEDYRQRLKELNAVDKLPAVITDIGVDEIFYQMLKKHQRLVNLESYMDDAWRSMLQKEMLETCTEKDGSIYRSPISAPIYSYSGIIYNKKMLAAAGYQEFPKTWDTFFECMNALRRNGVTPLSLQGKDTYWTSMLLTTAYGAKDEKGRAFLNEQFPSKYNNESMHDMMKFFKQIYDYTYEDVLDVDYTTARERLVNEGTAMIANGYWMFDTLSEEEQKMFGFASFPGNILMVSPKMTAWAVTTGYSEEITRGAVELMRFRVEESEKSRKTFMDTPGTLLINEYKEVVKNVSTIIPNYQLQWEQEIQNQFFDAYFPLYLEEKISREQLLNQMEEKAKSILLTR